jgi:hypothetical protein
VGRDAQPAAFESSVGGFPASGRWLPVIDADGTIVQDDERHSICTLISLHQLSTDKEGGVTIETGKLPYSTASWKVVP